MCDMFTTDDWRKAPATVDADGWFRDYFNANERTDSDPIYDFATMRWDACLEAKKTIEAKADSILKFVAVLAASMVTVAKIAGADRHTMLLLSPSIVLFGLCCIMSFVTMKASEWPSPINIRIALEQCDNCPKRQKTQLAASLHCCILAANLELKRKSKLLDCCTALAVAGTLALSIILFA